MSAAYQSERQAVTAMRAVIPPGPDRVILTPQQRREYLGRALEAAGVELSEFEERTAWWLCGIEDYTIAVIARWVRRPRTVTIDVSDANAYHVLTEALDQYASHERGIETGEQGREVRERWASLADRWVGMAEAARNEAQS